MKTVNLHKRSSLLRSVISEKCPHCQKGEVFKSGTGILSMPVMNVSCPSCRYTFEREPGYFLGAMYISYGIAVLVGILIFLLVHFLLPEVPTIVLPLAIIVVIMAIAKKNYKISRILYMYLFPW